MVSILTHTSVYTMKLSISLIHVYIYTIRYVKPKHIAPVRYTQNVFIQMDSNENYVVEQPNLEEKDL